MTKKTKAKAPAPAAFDRDFKEMAVKLASTGTKSTAEVARELGIPPYKLYNWVKASKQRSGASETGGSQVVTDEAYLNLQKKYRELEQENEILKKAAAYFARNLK